VTAPAHQPVLFDETIEALRIRPEGIYVDATYGRGGHSKEILRQLNKEGCLLILDRDPAAIAAARKNHENDKRVIIRKGPFSMLETIATENGLAGKIDGILFDLGVSSPQLDTAERGFSFQASGPLDMRMDTDTGESAADWLATVDEKTLVHVLKTYGEERFAKRIARMLLKAREIEPISDTAQLAKLVSEAIPARTREPGKHPATRTFQAIRIYINRELEEIEQALPQALRLLATGGRLAVISFHSLEDRIVKNFMRDVAKGDPFPLDLPVTQDQIKPLMKIVGKKIRPSDEEIERNPRSRSAVLRVAERTEVAYG
jgi:16S rRNA (cytosine1402-N4)-methyltransferase